MAKLPAREEEKRLRLYEQGLSDREIAEKCGISAKGIAIWRWRRKHPPKKSQATQKKKVQVPDSKIIKSPTQAKNSICWNCVNASPKKCKWVDRHKPIWDKAIELYRYANDDHLYSVQECKNFKPEVTT